MAQDDKVALVGELLARCAPWVRAYVGPRLWEVMDVECPVEPGRYYRMHDGKMAAENGGVALVEHDVILVAITCSLPYVRDTLHHEIWHVADLRAGGLNQEDVAAVDASVARGVAQPTAYLNSAWERRARAYAAWAVAYDEGWRPAAILGIPLSRTDRVFGYVYSGSYARDVAARRRIRPRLLPGQAAARRAISAAKSLVKVATAWPVLPVVAASAVYLFLAR